MPEQDDRLIQIVAERALQDEAFREAVKNHHVFRSLAEHPAWTLLEEKLERVEDEYLRGSIKRVMSGVPLDQREIDRARGFVQGVRSVLDLPNRIEEDFDQAIQLAWKRAAGDNEQEAD